MKKIFIITVLLLQIPLYSTDKITTQPYLQLPALSEGQSRPSRLDASDYEDEWDDEDEICVPSRMHCQTLCNRKTVCTILSCLCLSAAAAILGTVYARAF